MSKEIRKWFTVKHDTELLEPDEVTPKISNITADLATGVKTLVLTCTFTKYNVSKTNEIPTSAIIERKEDSGEYRVFAKLPLMFSDDNTAKIQFIDEKVENGKSYEYKIYAVNEKNIQAENDNGVLVFNQTDPVVASVPEIEFPEITFPTEPEPKLTSIIGELSQSLDGKALMLDCIYTAPSSLGNNECLPTSTIIERKEGDGDFRVHVRLPLFFPDGSTAKIQFVDEKIDPSKIYTYRIIATNEKGVLATPAQPAEISSEDIFVGEYNVYKTYNVNIRTDKIASKGSNGVIAPLDLFEEDDIETLKVNKFIDVGFMYGDNIDKFSVSGENGNEYETNAITEANWFDGVTLRDRQINEITDFTFEIDNSDVFGSTYKVLKLSNAIVEKYNFFELRNKNLKEPIHLIKLKKDTNELYISPELNRLSDVEINILLNDINNSTLYGIDFPILEVGDIAKSKNIDDWKFELYYSSEEQTDANLGISENDKIVDDIERDGASDYSPSSNPDDFTLAYRGKSSKAEFTMPTNYGSIKYYSAILYVKWKKPVIERAAKLAKFLSSFIKESPGIELDNIKLITVDGYDLFHAFEYSNKIVNEATIDRLTGVSDNLKEFINPPTSQVDLTDFVK